MIKQRIALYFLVALAMAMFSGSAGASPITILNPSFELPAQSSGGFTIGTITDWTVVGVTGVFFPQLSQLPTPSDGNQVGYSNAGSASQILAATLTANTQYTLQIDFTARKDCCTFIGADVQLIAGATVVASNSIPNLAAGGAQTLSVNFGALAGNPLLGQALQIRIATINTGGQIDFDNVRLDGSPITVDGVPEPGTFVLAGLGILAVMAKRSRA